MTSMPSMPTEANGRRRTTPRQSSIASSRSRPLQSSASAQDWLDFVAGLLAQAAWAERVTDTGTRTSDFSCPVAGNVPIPRARGGGLSHVLLCKSG